MWPRNARTMAAVTQGPRCIFCGTARPVEVDQCPACGRPWIDERITGDDDPYPPGAGARTIEAPIPVTAPVDVDGARRVPRWLIAAGVALLAIAAYAVTFGVLLTDDDAPPEAAAPTSTAAATTSTSTATTSTSTTTSTTTTSTTTTSTTTTTLPPLEAVGSPLDPTSLDLGAFALGPFRFGSDAGDAIGRLVATFDQPDGIEQLSGTSGLCGDEQGRRLRWGHLTIITRFDDGDTETLVGYTTDTDGDADHPTAELATLSGATVGMTLAELDRVYQASAVEPVTIDGAPHYLVLRSSDRRTLLWGPLAGDGDDATVAGINSPNSCDGGPTG